MSDNSSMSSTARSMMRLCKLCSHRTLALLMLSDARKMQIRGCARDIAFAGNLRDFP